MNSTEIKDLSSLGLQGNLDRPCNVILDCNKTRITGMEIGDLVENETRITLGITSYLRATRTV